MRIAACSAPFFTGLQFTQSSRTAEAPRACCRLGLGRKRVASAINTGSGVEQGASGPRDRSYDKQSRYLLDLVLVAVGSNLVQ